MTTAPVFATRAPERLAHSNLAVGEIVRDICRPRDNAPTPAERAAAAAAVLRDYFLSTPTTHVIHAAEAEEAKAS